MKTLTPEITIDSFRADGVTSGKKVDAMPFGLQTTGPLYGFGEVPNHRCPTWFR